MSKKSIVLIVILLGALAGAGYVVLLMQFEQKAEEAVSRERAAWQQKTESLEQKAGSLEKEVKKLTGELQVAEQGPPPDVERQQEAFGEQAAAPEDERAAICASAQAFFSYLDRKGYLRDRGIQMTAREYMRTIIERLRASTPVISGENQDVYILVKNISFFFRTLGKTDTLLLRDVLRAESDIMEQAFSLFYRWLDAEQPMEDPDRITVPFETMYEYAAFFLQTMAGRSYLFRRDARVRLLAQYYSVCIVDRAEDRMLNTYGVDVKTCADMLAAEIGSSRLLHNRREYMKRLEEIGKKRMTIKREGA